MINMRNLRVGYRHLGRKEDRGRKGQRERAQERDWRTQKEKPTYSNFQLQRWLKGSEDQRCYIFNIKLVPVPNYSICSLSMSSSPSYKSAIDNLLILVEPWGI